MNSIENQAVFSVIPVIKENRNYWFVRTLGGQYFEHFVSGNYIAINYDEITLHDIAAAERDAVGLFNLTEKIRSTYSDEKRPGHISNQLVKFAYSIKAGDIVFIPNEDSVNLYFGEVEETPTYISEGDDGCPYKKRKKVKWIKSVLRKELDSSFYKLMFSHQTITDAAEFAGDIDRLFHSLYIKGEKAHMILEVTSEEAIGARTFYGMGNILPLVDEFCDEEGIGNDGDYKIKSNVESPGHLEVITLSMFGLVAFGLILVAIAGGGFNFSYKSETSDTKVGMETDGIIEKLRRFLNSKSDRKERARIIEKSMDDMGVKTPGELIKIIEKIKKD